MNHEHKHEKYYLASNGDFVDQMFFDWATAEASKFKYLEAFDEDGKKVQIYMLVDTGSEEFYTTDF